MRALTLAAVALTFATAFALYYASYRTRQLELQVQTEERTAEKVRADIAALRAERAYLTRPQRIEPLARQQGLGPMSDGQLVRQEEPQRPAGRSEPRQQNRSRRD